MQPSWQRSSFYFHGLCWPTWLGSGGEVSRMTHEAPNEMDSIPLRVNDLERGQGLHDHRLRVLEEERLPHRMALTERSAEQALKGVDDLKSEVTGLRDDQVQGFKEMGQAIGKITSLFKGAMWAFGIVGTILVALNIAVDLVPKIDAMIIEKNPPVEQHR